MTRAPSPLHDVNRRRAVGLHLRGFTSTEIAQLLGWTEPKARNLTHRGLKDLRELGVVTHEDGGYRLSPSGTELMDALKSLQTWSTRWASTADRGANR